MREKTNRTRREAGMPSSAAGDKIEAAILALGWQFCTAQRDPKEGWIVTYGMRGAGVPKQLPACKRADQVMALIERGDL